MTRQKIVGVDLDGVLGNQVIGVLERENKRLGLALTYEQVIHWDFKFGDTSFVPAIRTALEDPQYILQMPVHEGASQMLRELSEAYVVRILTVRPADVLGLTESWLATNQLAYDDLVPAEEALKSRHGADALIDDYAGNIAEFLSESRGIAILVDQPWNQSVAELAPWLDSRRLHRVSTLRDVAPRLHYAFVF